jgi:hypothetical protein
MTIKIASTNNQTSITTSFHPKILDTLFAHKRAIYFRLCDLKGLHYLDHIAIYLVTPTRQIIPFSISPSVEFNLITQELWRYDGTFFPKDYPDNLAFWDELYHPLQANALKQIKETAYEFTLGFNFRQICGEFTLIYAFATKKHEENLKNYYKNVQNELKCIGDYGYKYLRPLFEQYTNNEAPPILAPNPIVDKPPHLTLIYSAHDNDKKPF